MPFIAAADLLGRFAFVGDMDRGLRAFVGIGYERIEFKDPQPVRNRIIAELAPAVTIGVGGRF